MLYHIYLIVMAAVIDYLAIVSVSIISCNLTNSVIHVLVVVPFAKRHQKGCISTKDGIICKFMCKYIKVDIRGSIYIAHWAERHKDMESLLILLSSYLNNKYWN